IVIPGNRAANAEKESLSHSFHTTNELNQIEKAAQANANSRVLLLEPKPPTMIVAPSAPLPLFELQPFAVEAVLVATLWSVVSAGLLRRIGVSCLQLYRLRVGARLADAKTVNACHQVATSL